jgi:glyoxylase-like metal-dependent hydrolase (beta-lactamase superfamily II)
LDEGLHRLGLEVGDIDYVILTHSHYDHSSDLRRFYNAKAIIQYSELQQIEHPFGYLKPRLPPDFAGIFKGVRWEIVDGDTRLDSQLELLLTPGHSAGGQSVSVRTHKGTEVITGWCCMQENFAPPLSFQERGYPFTINASHTNPVELYESTQRIIDLADVIIPCHEYRPKEP